MWPPANALPWVAGHWVIADSELASLHWDEAQQVLCLRLSVAQWVRAPGLPPAYWPGIWLRFERVGGLETPLPFAVGRISQGQWHAESASGQAQMQWALQGSAQPGARLHWVLSLPHGEQLSWRCDGVQAWCDEGSTAREWLHC